jgi:UDP-2,3-diacylglucosamine hydrolase
MPESMPEPMMRASGTAATTEAETIAFFVSDLHLQPSMPRTAQAFLDFLQKHALKAQQLYLLGDLFEAWAGDDDIATPFNRQIIGALRSVADAGVAVFWIAGNRDFLIGADFAAAAGLTLLPDPFVIDSGPHRVILSHGDTLCTDDLGYMAFRAQVRQAAWQQAFLALPLAQRKALIAEMRDGSRAEQRLKPAEIMDVNSAAVATLFAASDSNVMIHGHTHRPARHEHAGAKGVQLRYVLPDWDCDAAPPRGGWIALTRDGQLHRFAVDGTELA